MARQSNPQEPSNLDYRQSHLLKGEQYDALLASEPYDAYMSRQEEIWLRRVIPSLFPHGVPRYLDFACGTGRILKVASEYASETVAVDVSESMVAKARIRCPAASFIVGDITRRDPRGELGTFDLVTAFRFLGNAQDELRVSALQAIHRVLNDDGYFVFNNHRNPLSSLALMGRLRGSRPPMDLSHFKLRALLRASGFHIVSSRGLGAWILRHKHIQEPVLESRVARVLESWCGGPALVPLCLDALIVARKRRPR